MSLHSKKTMFFSIPVRAQKFCSYYKPYRRLFAADMVCAMVVSAISLSMPLCIRYLTQDVLGGGGKNLGQTILFTSLLMLGLIVLQSACTLFYDHMGHVLGARMERDMRNDLFAHYQNLPFSFFDREKTGSIISRLINDLLSMAELCHHGPEDIIIYALTFVGALVLLFRINAPLTLIIAAFLPLMFLFSLFYCRILNRSYTENRKTIAGLSARIEDSMAGIRTVKSFANEELEREKFRAVNEQFCQSRSEIYKHEARYDVSINTFFARLLVVAAVVSGGVLLSRKTLNIADFITFLLYVNYLTAPIPQLARITAQYQEGLSGFNRLMDILEMPTEDNSNTAALLPEKIWGRIEFNNVSFRYSGGEDYVLKNVSFTVDSGEYVALSGPSGIGKSTLCSLIPRFYTPTEGSITLDSIDIRTVSLVDLRSRIGVVQQDCYVFSGTVRENIAYGKPGACEADIIAAAKKASAHEFIMALPAGYDTPLGERGLTISGGQRQRLCIARVFLKDPPVLIFDEATSALDIETERVIQEGLRDLSKDRTTIVIAHRLSTLQHADRVLVLDGEGIRG